MQKNQTISNLIRYIEESPTAYHTVINSARILDESGFTAWNPGNRSVISPGAKFYTVPFPTCLFAFSIGEAGNDPSWKLRIGAAHTDSPCFHIKPNPDVAQKSYLKLNVDVYGGPILNTWFDRPLSIAGSVALKKAGSHAPEIRVVDLKAPLLTITNLAIHMNRDVNKGVEINTQTDIMPLLGTLDGASPEGSFLSCLADELHVQTDDILDFDLFIYNTEAALLQGRNDEYLSAPRLDNLTSCLALLNAITTTPPAGVINIVALFDNEEIGSLTARGADSETLPILLENIYEALGKSRSELNTDILNGTLLSVDVAHALHPNLTGKYDPTNYALLNDGVSLKLNSSQRYINNLETLSRLELLLEREGIPYKKFVNRSDVPGGSTIGNKIATRLPMSGLDIGIPILAMHSAREMMGVNDQSALQSLLAAFFGQVIS